MLTVLLCTFFLKSLADIILGKMDIFMLTARLYTLTLTYLRFSASGNACTFTDTCKSESTWVRCVALHHLCRVHCMAAVYTIPDMPVSSVRLLQRGRLKILINAWRLRQISFLSGLQVIGEIRTLFAAEVQRTHPCV
jgi:hypothetical protein